MDTHTLTIALQVATHGSIAAAARALGMDPSSVSRTIAALETDLNIRLFNRTTRRLSVTEEGNQFLERVAPVVQELNAAKEAARGFRAKPSGLVRLTTSVAFACKKIVPLLPRLHAEYPEISISLHSSDANLDLVEYGMDLAIRLAPAPEGDLISTRLMTTRYRVVASPDYVAGTTAVTHPADLIHHSCLRFALPGLQDTWRFRQDGGESLTIPVSGPVMISNAMALREAALMGQGVAMLADWLIDRDVLAGHLIDLLPGYACTLSDFDTAAWALYLNRTYMPQKLRVVIDFLKAELRQSH